MAIGVSDLNGKVHYTDKSIIIKLTSDEKKYLGTVSGSLTIDSDRAVGTRVRGNGVDNITDEKGNFSVTLPNGTGGVWGDRITAPWLDELVTVFSIPNGGEEKDVRVFTRLKKDTTPPGTRKTLCHAAVSGKRDQERARCHPCRARKRRGLREERDDVVLGSGTEGLGVRGGKRRSVQSGRFFDRHHA